MQLKNLVLFIKIAEMKIYIFLCFLLVSTISKSQTIDWAKTPVDLNVLIEHTNYSKATLLPKFENGKFYYINAFTNKKAFTNTFDEAYPFINKSALVKKDEHYGIINEKGLFIITPKYKRVSIPSYEKHMVVFDDTFTYDMLKGKEYLGDFISCKEPAVPNLRIFKYENKYGVSDSSKRIILEAIYDTILHIDFDFIIAKYKNKIGVVNLENKQIIPFEYSDYTISVGNYFRSPQTIGFKKENNWRYYRISNDSIDKEITKSSYKCTMMYNIHLKNAIGIFEENKQYNVLFKDGEILDSYYEWISSSAKIGTKNGEIYFINDDRSVYRYY